MLMFVRNVYVAVIDQNSRQEKKCDSLAQTIFSACHVQTTIRPMNVIVDNWTK